MIDLDNELAREYLAESREHLATLESDLLAMEADGTKFDERTVDRAFRAVHSVKGGAGLFNLGRIRDLAHQAEDVLAKVRARQMVPTPDRIGILLRATDRLNELIRNPGTSNQTDNSEIAAALARVQAGQPAPAETCGAVASGQASPGERRLRSLLVEDDFASRLVLQTFLSRYGECHIAVNGTEAVEACRAALDCGQPYDLICMDIMMPEMDGREAVRRVRGLEEAQGIFSTAGAKIIMTTAVDDMREVIRCFQELCDAYLIKPIDLSKLLSQMRSYQLVQ